MCTSNLKYHLCKYTYKELTLSFHIYAHMYVYTYVIVIHKYNCYIFSFAFTDSLCGIIGCFQPNNRWYKMSKM